MGVEVVKKNATFDIRRSTFDLSVVARRLSIVDCPFSLNGVKEPSH